MVLTCFHIRCTWRRWSWARRQIWFVAGCRCSFAFRTSRTSCRSSCPRPWPAERRWSRPSRTPRAASWPEKQINYYLHKFETFYLIILYKFLGFYEMSMSGGELLELRLLDTQLLDTFGRKSTARHFFCQLLAKLDSSSWQKKCLMRHINWKSQFFSYRNGK